MEKIINRNGAEPWWLIDESAEVWHTPPYIIHDIIAHIVHSLPCKCIFWGQMRSLSAVIVCSHHLLLSLLVMIHASASALHEKLGMASRGDGATSYTSSSDFQTLLSSNRKKLCNQNGAMLRNSRCSPKWGTSHFVTFSTNTDVTQCFISVEPSGHWTGDVYPKLIRNRRVQRCNFIKVSIESKPFNISNDFWFVSFWKCRTPWLPFTLIFDGLQWGAILFIN